MKIVIDATDGVLGRVASFAAKQALFGKEVAVVNCNSVLVLGNKRNTIEKYKAWVKKGGSSLKGPRVIRSPERIMKRTIRGMLPHKQGRGADALKRVMCYNSVPLEFASVEKIGMKRELKFSALKLNVLCKEL